MSHSPRGDRHIGPSSALPARPIGAPGARLSCGASATPRFSPAVVDATLEAASDWRPCAHWERINAMHALPGTVVDGCR
jgi:hypothetical protein